MSRIRSTFKHCSAASVLSCRNIIEDVAPSIDFDSFSDNIEAREHLSSVLEMEETIPREVVSGLSQKDLTVMMDGRLQNSLLDAAETPREKARLLSVQLPHAGDWLQVIPSPTLGLQLRAAELRTAVLYRLGEPLFQGDGACQGCGRHSDRLGDHAIACASQGERIARHNHLRDALFHAAASASLAPLREERALLPGVEQRPADVLLPNFAGGLHCCVDVCVVSSLQAQMVNGAAEEPGHALQARYSQKWDKYGAACQDKGMVSDWSKRKVRLWLGQQAGTKGRL